MPKTFLMCEPEFFGVEYVINPHMSGNVGTVNRHLAFSQWENLVAVIQDYADVCQIAPEPDLPDMVFTANAGLVDRYEGRFIPSSFKFAQRQRESKMFEQWFADRGWEILNLSNESTLFEGAGDCLVDARGQYWMGHGHRSNEQAADDIKSLFELEGEVITLKLTNPNYYHLDIVFCPLDTGAILWHSDAFDALSRQTVEFYALIHDIELIDISEDDAKRFACNSVSIGNNLIMPYCSIDLEKKLSKIDVKPIVVNVSEFIKAGGAVKCLTLQF